MHGNYDRLRGMFADQFEPDGQGFVYRKSLRGAPVQVSAAERDRYIDLFNRFTKYAAWCIGGSTAALGLSVAAYATAARAELPTTILYCGLGAIVLAFLAANHWIWNLPARELRSRQVTGVARSRAEMRKINLQYRSYGQIAISAGAAVYLLLRFNSNGDMLSGWHLLWTVLAAIGLILCASQVFLKWRVESRK
jgi:hypothetical protein